MTEQIAVRIPSDDLKRLDAIVAAGGFDSRAAAIREGLRRILRERREADVRRIYESAYRRHPEDEAIGEAGAVLGAEILAVDEAGNG